MTDTDLRCSECGATPVVIPDPPLCHEHFWISCISTAPKLTRIYRDGMTPDGIVLRFDRRLGDVEVHRIGELLKRSGVFRDKA